MQIIWIMLFYLYTIGGYYWFSNQQTTRHLETSLDKLIPLVPIFIIPYLAATLLFLTIPIIFYKKLGWLKTKKYLIVQTIATTIGYLVYFLFPTSVIRTPIEGTGFLVDAVRWLHATDGATAAFPSGHNYHTLVIVYFLIIYFPKSKWPAIVFYLLVMASTVFLKQHYLPDIFGGIATAVLAILITKKILPN